MLTKLTLFKVNNKIPIDRLCERGPYIFPEQNFYVESNNRVFQQALVDIPYYKFMQAG